MTESEYLMNRDSLSIHSERLRKLDLAIQKLDDARKEAERILDASRNLKLKRININKSN